VKFDTTGCNHLGGMIVDERILLNSGNLLLTQWPAKCSWKQEITEDMMMCYLDWATAHLTSHWQWKTR